jgi:membrane associated rhomboid family serine protease
VLDNLLPFLLAAGDAGIAHGAHIGGFVLGLAAALTMRGRRPPPPQPSY